MSGATRGHLAMLLFSALVAGSFSLGALMANMISPVAFTAVRFLFAGAGLRDDGPSAWHLRGTLALRGARHDFRKLLHPDV